MEQDPSRVLLRYQQPQDIEVAAFISAMLAFGRRDLFLPKIDYLLDLSDKSGGPCTWVSSGLHRKTFPPSNCNPKAKFYRFYSFNDIHLLLCRLESILQEDGSLGEFLRLNFEKLFPEKLMTAVDSGERKACRGDGSSHQKGTVLENHGLLLARLIGEAFSECKIVPKGKNSANKRVHMFLRWMVRTNSPVDLGLWQWIAPSQLLIPLDTHVLQQSTNLGLLPSKANGTARYALELTKQLARVWPQDPCKGDFALFGLGVSEKEI